MNLDVTGDILVFQEMQFVESMEENVPSKVPSDLFFDLPRVGRNPQVSLPQTRRFLFAHGHHRSRLLFIVNPKDS